MYETPQENTQEQSNEPITTEQPEEITTTDQLPTTQEPVESFPVHEDVKVDEAGETVEGETKRTPEEQAVFDLGEDEQHTTEGKRERLPSDYDVTEMELIQKREQSDIERRAMLVEKEKEEQQKKTETQRKAEEELRNWTEQRKEDIIQKRTQNKIEEESFNESRKALSMSNNPWEKVTGNVDIKEGNYQGIKDVSRMRQAMISRRNDVKHGIIKFATSE